ncbi:MAG: glycosyltransferase [Parachlamydiales bacterium]|jgi:rhamnosyltransferase
MNKTIGICVLTLNGEKHLHSCLTPLLKSDLKPRVLVIDSSSSDLSVSIAKSLGAETLVIPRHQFNHGTTREMGRKHLNTDIVVMVTQDAYACDEYVLGKLVQPLLEGNASASYARQLPHSGAEIFESFHRQYNYPPESELRTLKDLPKKGKKIYFFSNSFSCYLNSALDEIGGFEHLLLGEDTLAAARLLHQGHAIAYTADALVHHSHRYGLKEEFQRHFDTGYARYNFDKVIACTQSDNAQGKAYMQKLMQYAWQHSPQSLPYAVLLILTKWTGYTLGRWGHRMPPSYNRFFSAYKGFWQRS